MYGFKKAVLNLQKGIKTITDPDENGTTPILNNVELGDPENIGLYDGPLAILIFANTPQTGAIGIGGEFEQAKIQGAVLTFIPGTNTKSVLKCLHYSDIIGDYLENTPHINPDETNTHDWRTVNVSKTKTPKMCTAGATKFTLIKNKIIQ